MSLDNQGARPLAPGEQVLLHAIERDLGEDAWLRAALYRHEAPPRSPGRVVVGACLGSGCVAVGAAALVGGPLPAVVLLSVLVIVGLVVTAVVLCRHR